MAWKRLLWIVTLVASLGFFSTEVASASSSYTAAQAAATPFDSPNVFCTKVAPLPGTRNSSNPGVTPTSITLTDLGLDVAQLRKLGLDQMDFSEAYKAFVDEVNKCGGVNGRKLILKRALYNPVAPDLLGHTQAQCIKATEDYKSFMTIGVGPPPNGQDRCVTIQHKTIMIGPTNTPSTDYDEAKGRLVTFSPAGDKLALASIVDNVNQSTFKGHTVGVIGAATTPTATHDQQDQYVDVLESHGVKVADLEVLPCTGTVCTVGAGNAVRRLKDKGVDLIVMTTFVTTPNVGAIFSEMQKQNLKAPVYSPDNSSLHADSNMAATLRATGSVAMNFIASNGWYTTMGTDLTTLWRTGQAKKTAFGEMCNATYAKALGQAPFQFIEKDLSNARYGGVTTTCRDIRSIARAIYTLGNNVTTERMVQALKVQMDTDRRDTGPHFHNGKRWYTAGDTAPSGVTTMKFQMPCTRPTISTSPCFLPQDQPARVRPVKY